MKAEDAFAPWPVRWARRGRGFVSAAVVLGLVGAAVFFGRPTPREARASAPASQPPPALAAIGPAPEDFHVSIQERGAGFVLRAKRDGHLVALLGAGARSSRAGEASLSVDLAQAGEAAARAALDRGLVVVWETSALGDTAIERGLLTVRRSGLSLVVEAELAARPAIDGRWRGAHHACEAHDDAVGGFAVLCRFDATARVVEAANLTGDWPHDDVALSRDRATVVRMDLPLDGDDVARAESRLVAFHVGRTGWLLDVDATRVPGEPKAVTVALLGRDQPVADAELDRANFLAARRAAEARGNKARAAVSARTR